MEPERSVIRLFVIVHVKDDEESKVEEWQWKGKNRYKFKKYFRVTRYHTLTTNNVFF